MFVLLGGIVVLAVHSRFAFLERRNAVGMNSYELVKLFFLLTFAAAIPAIISDGIAISGRFYLQSMANPVLIGRVGAKRYYFNSCQPTASVHQRPI